MSKTNDDIRGEREQGKGMHACANMGGDWPLTKEKHVLWFIDLQQRQRHAHFSPSKSYVSPYIKIYPTTYINDWYIINQ